MTLLAGMTGLIPIKSASDCPECECCGDPWCDEHEEHYADCTCVGPHNAEDFNLELVVIDGRIWGVPI